ncbi:hypothetical protein CDD80_1156 [Ophiocordyceps camponoti-rufipedis]|uniref:Uncharacterized protein n=1 Tax=Ophiocordyceps camponoti-rufipedis TaxID=2004952 RepID=A0A2C5Z774_9HYPO|nr:hypothetical protein CDD80_1156 [Ophiocordyceps camponoti-rufipedis]
MDWPSKLAPRARGKPPPPQAGSAAWSATTRHPSLPPLAPGAALRLKLPALRLDEVVVAGDDQCDGTSLVRGPLPSLTFPLTPVPSVGPPHPSTLTSPHRCSSLVLVGVCLELS